MRLLTVNAGSSSIRLTAYIASGSSLQRLHTLRDSVNDAPDSVLAHFLKQAQFAKVDAAVHRVVHGGERLATPRLVDATVEQEIQQLAPLAPLHNPVQLAWIQLCRKVLGRQTRQVAVFDTTFFAPLPAVARHYALPQALGRRHGIRRYGFHGLAHTALWRSWRRVRPDVPQGGRAISLQLGSGCSAAAIDRGVPRDTSMGFSPLEGLVMATRPGDIDPGAILFLQKTAGLGPDALERLLNQSSGLLGVSGESGDMRRLLASTQADARLAVELYCYRIRKYIGAYLAVLGGTDAILFGGGVGERAAAVRRQVLRDMQWCGVHLDEAANAAAVEREACISTADSRVAVWVLPVDEAAVMAAEALRVLADAPTVQLRT